METIGKAGLAYNGRLGASDLRKVLTKLLQEPETTAVYRQLAQQWAHIEYTWKAVTDACEALSTQPMTKTVGQRQELMEA